MLVDPSYDAAFMVHVRATKKSASLALIAFVLAEPVMQSANSFGMLAFTLLVTQYISIVVAQCAILFVSGSTVRGKWYVDPIPEINYHKMLFYIETGMNAALLCFLARLLFFMYRRGFTGE